MAVTFLTNEDKQELLDSIEAGVDTLKNTIVTEEVNLLSLYPAEDKVMSKTDTKVVFYDHTSYKTVFIPVEAGKTYYMSYISTAYTSVRHALLDTNKAGAATAYTQENCYTDTTIVKEAQSDGYYAICLQIGTYNAAQVVVAEGKPFTGGGGYTLSGAVELAPEHIEQVKSALPTSTVEGKKLGVIGDSITVGYMVTGKNADDTWAGGYVTKKWYDYVVERYGFASVQANAEIGRSFTKDGSMSTRITQKIKELDSDLDVIVVFGGTNDFNWSPTIGSMDDAPAETSGGLSFFSALRFTAEYLLTNYPNARIIFMTPLPRKNSEGFNGKDTNGKRVLDYADAISEMCRCYGFDLVDLNHVGGFYVWNDAWLNAHMMDGLHPNETGTEIYVKNGILPKLDSIFL